MEWTILDFNFPDKLPFSFLKKRFGDQAEIFLSYVSIPLDELPEKIDGMTTAYDNRPELLGYTERAVTNAPRNQRGPANLQSFTRSFSIFVKEEEHESCDVSGPSAGGYSPADPG